MKKYLAGLAVGVLVALGSGIPAHASLVVSGTVDYMGAARNLIYDNDLDITWLDYTKSSNTWSNQTSWAANLALTVNGVTYDNWRLPATVDGPYVYGYDGTTTGGYNITTSEMGHLFYTELGNKGYYDTNGNSQAGYGLTNTGAFDNLVSSWYRSGTEYAYNPPYAWVFDMDDGNQSVDNKDTYLYVLAVLPGQIQAVPEPGSMLLIGSGLAGLVCLGKRRRGH
ncbi:MAG: PEP-CTERM sorting domain-containing protein [bacterium]